MSNLMYNSSTDIKVERGYLANLQTPDPRGSRHAPYPFHSFATDENRLFGLLKVSRPVAPVAPSFGMPALHQPNWDLLVGLRGAHDQSVSRGLVVGTIIEVCSNLSFHGNLGSWQSKQTTNIAHRIPEMVADAVSGLGNAGKKLTVDFDDFNRHQIDRDTGDDILLDVYRSGGFSASQLGRAIEDWDNCSIEEHTANGRNLWWLFNSATQALKPTGANSNHSDLQHRSTILYNKLLAGGQRLLAA